MSPRFFFTIDEIAEDPNATHIVDRLGNWIPSTDAEENRRVAGGVSGQLWFCDTQRIYQVAQPVPAKSISYKTFSVYFVSGFGFWVLRGDATNPSDDEVWLPLRFDYSNRNSDYSSFLTNAGQHPTLHIQRPDQRWPTMLLPDIYHGPVHETAQGYGGIKGELPIFLALMATSVPREYLPNVLPTFFTGGAWQVHPYRIPRTNQRGVVVTVYTCPQTWAGGSTATELAQYENGNLGKYFN